MQPAEKMSVTMAPDMARDIRASVEAGEYASASEALRDAVRLWQRERQERHERLQAIRAQAGVNAFSWAMPLTTSSSRGICSGLVR